MKPAGHIIASLGSSGLVFMFFKSSGAFFLSLLSGILIDIDHIFDYYLQEGFTFRIGRVLRWCYNLKFQRMILIFHSLELLIIFWLLISIFKLGLPWIAVAAGLTQHIILDLVFNGDKIYSYAYFLSYRWLKGFRKEKIFRLNYIRLP